jgi:hypothetical protein
MTSVENKLLDEDLNNGLTKPIKLNFPLEEAMKAQRESRNTALLFL